MKKTAAIVIFLTLVLSGCQRQPSEPLFVQPELQTTDDRLQTTETPIVTASPSASPKSTSTKPQSQTPHLVALSIIQLPSVNKSDNSRDLKNIDTIVIHTLYNPNASGDLSITRAKEVLDEAAVSSHYVIARDGKVYQLVPEQYQAWHAGESTMPARSASSSADAGGPAPDGRSGVNPFSLGIELIATETSGITRAQYDALTALVVDISGRIPIKHVLGHSDIAPKRKTDPWKFDWKTWQKSLTAQTAHEFIFYH